MIFVTSLVVCFGLLIILPIVLILLGNSVFTSILYGVLAFIISIAFFCLLIIILLPIVGDNFAKTYNPKDRKRWLFMIDVARFSCFWLFIKIKVEGLEKIDPNKTIVFYSNHQSYIDPLIYHTAFSKIPHASMYKEVISKYRLASGMAKALGGVSINRSDDRSALESVIKAIKEVKSGVNFFAFPEGTRSKGIGMHHYKAGSFKIAQKADCQMVICAIDGSYRKRLSIPFFYTPVYIKVVDVIDSKSLQGLNTNDISERAEKMTKDAINEIRKNHFVMKPAKYMYKKLEIQKKNEDVF